MQWIIILNELRNIFNFSGLISNTVKSDNYKPT